MLQKIGGNFIPDFGDWQAMTFDEEEKKQHDTLHFISDMVLHTKRNEKVAHIMQRLRVRKMIVDSLLSHNQRHMILKNKNIMQAFINERLLEMIDKKSHLPMVLEQRADRFQTVTQDKIDYMPNEVIGPLFDNDEFLEEIKKDLKREEFVSKQSWIEASLGTEQKGEIDKIVEIK